MIKVVIFDLDDTLISESDFAYSAFNEISLYLSDILCCKSEHIIKEMKDLYIIEPKNIFDRLFVLHGAKLQNNVKEKLISMYRNHYPKLVLSLEVKDLLKTLKQKGFKLGIITDGYKESQRNKLDSLNMTDMIDNIIVTDELGRDYWKPNPKAFEMMKEFFNVRFSEMIYVGDNPNKDFIAPAMLGMRYAMLRKNNSLYQKNYEKENCLSQIPILTRLDELFQYLESEKS